MAKGKWMKRDCGDSAEITVTVELRNYGDGITVNYGITLTVHLTSIPAFLHPVCCPSPQRPTLPDRCRLRDEFELAQI